MESSSGANQREGEITLLPPSSIDCPDAHGEETELIVIPEISHVGRQETENFEGDSVKLNLQAGGLCVQMETRVAARTQMVELKSRLDLTTQMLDETRRELSAALKRIGYLEALLSASSQTVERQP